MQRMLLGALLVIAFASAAFLGLRWLAATDSGNASGERAATRGARSVEGSAAEASGPDAEILAPEGDAVQAPGASTARLAVDRRRDLGGHALDVAIVWPANTPEDEELVLWAFPGAPADEVDALIDGLELPGADQENAAFEHRIGRERPAAVTFTLPRTPAWSDAVWLVARGRYLYSARPEKLRLPPDGDADETPAAVRATLEPLLGAWVRGSLVDEDEARADRTEIDVRLTFERAGLQSPVQLPGTPARSGARRTRSDAAGRFEFRGVIPDGDYRVEGVPLAYAAWRTAVWNFEPGLAYDLSIPLEPGGTVVGRVVDEAGGPVVGAPVRVEREPRFMGLGGFAVRFGQTDADGRFELEAVATGDALVLVDPEDLLDARTDVTVVEARTVDAGTLTVPGGGTIRGVVRWPDGEPAGGAQVGVEFDRSQLGGMGAFNAMRGASGAATCDDEGRFAVRGLGLGPFQVRATAPAPSAEPRAAEDVREDAEASAAELPSSAPAWSATERSVRPGAELELTLAAPVGIAGRVVDFDGAPVAAFTLRARLPSSGALGSIDHATRTATIADPAGRFWLEDLQHGRWVLRAAAEGFAESDELEVTVPDPDPGMEHLIRLTPGAVVSGRVLLPDGTPASAGSGARVAPELDMLAYIDAAMGRRDVPQAAVDADGRFRLGGLPAGDLALVAEAVEYAPSAPLVVALEPGVELSDQVLVLRVGGRITGEVYGADGDPAAGVQVIVQTQQGRDQQMQSAASDGGFEFERLAPGSYQVIAMLADLGDGDLTDENSNTLAFLESLKMKVVQVADAEEVHVLLGEPPAFPVELSGRVLADGAPVKGVLVQVVPVDGGLAGMRMTTTDTQGRYAMTLDRPGAMLASVSRTSASGIARQSVELPLEVPSEPAVRIDLELPIATIAGQVEGPDGRPLAGARVTVTGDGPVASGMVFGGHYAETTTESDGRYHIEWLPPGRYAVAAGGALMGGGFGVDTELYGREVRPGVRVSDGEQLRGIDFRLEQAGAIAGTVVDEADKPVAGVTAFVRDANGTPLERLSLITTDGAGRFEVSGVRAGTYTVIARGSGWGTEAPAAVRVAAGETAAVRVRVTRGATLVVRLLDDDGEPTRGLVLVLDEEGVQQNGMLSMSDLMAAMSGGEDATLAEEQIGPLAPGRYRIEAEGLGGETGTKRVRIDAGDVAEGGKKRVTLRLQRD